MDGFRVRILGLLVLVLLVATGGLVDGTRADEPKKTPKAQVDREKFRYDGKPFAYWNEYLKIELKPERRIEALEALGAFGVAGYAKEATTTILEVYKQYAKSKTLSDKDRKVRDEIYQTIHKIGGEAISTLVSQIKKEHAAELYLALKAQATSTLSKKDVAILVEFVLSEDPKARTNAFVLFNSTPMPILKATLPQTLKTETTRSRFFRLLLEEVHTNSTNLLWDNLRGEGAGIFLTDRTRDLIRVAAALDTETKTKVVLEYIKTVKNLKRDKNIDLFAYTIIELAADLKTNPKKIVPELVQIVKSSKNDVLRIVAVKGLGAFGAAAQEAIPSIRKLWVATEKSSLSSKH